MSKCSACEQKGMRCVACIARVWALRLMDCGMQCARPLERMDCMA